MQRRDVVMLFVLGLVLNLLVALLQRVPGYMDAEYYYAGGIRLHEGHGFSEMILWNYLDNPAGLPHPSHLYWMPLASIIAAGGMALAGTSEFLAARIGFLVLAACIPPLTAGVAFSLFRDRRLAWWAGWLGVFSGFYALYLNLTETFALYMLLGLLFTQVALGPSRRMGAIGSGRRAALMGILAGLMHLSRADGLLWLAAALAVQGIIDWRQRDARRFLPILATATGYLLVMGPWMLRNVLEAGSPLAPGGSRALWIRDYDQTFAYPAEVVSYSTWLASGLGTLLAARWHALMLNLQNTLAVQGSVYLLPLMILGGWQARRDARVQFTAGMWLATLAFMTLVFPYAGSRGGFLHSSAALTPMLWILAAGGLQRAIAWGATQRGWHAQTAWRVLSGGACVLQVALTIGLVVLRGAGPAWSAESVKYTQIEAQLVSLGAQPSDVVMVKNPPGYWVATRRAAIVIPDGNVSSTLEAAKRYGASYVILEAEHVRGLDSIYKGEAVADELRLVAADDTVKILRILP